MCASGWTAWIPLLVSIATSSLPPAELRRLRSVDSADPSRASSVPTSAEFIWSTTTVALGDTAVLHCSFDAIFQQLRTGSIDWVKESPSLPTSERTDDVTKQNEPNYDATTGVVEIASGKKLMTSDKRYRVYRPHNSALSVLIVRRTRKQDTGVYRCNLAGSSTRHKYMVLNVTESKIEAQTSPNKMVARAGADVALWCNATGYPKPVVYWTREDRNHKLPDGNLQFWGNELYFEKASETDTGIYTCFVDNFVQPVVSYKFSLIVEDSPWYVDGSKMRFDSSQWYPQDSLDPRPVRGRSFLLLCETRGSPQPLPSVAWYRDGRPLRNSKHFYIIEDSPEWRVSYTSSTLVIMRFRADYQGNYTCVASNAFRMKKQTFRLSGMEVTEDIVTSSTSPKAPKHVPRTSSAMPIPFTRKPSGTGSPDRTINKPVQEKGRPSTALVNPAGRDGQVPQRGDVVKLVELPGPNRGIGQQASGQGKKDSKGAAGTGSTGAAAGNSGVDDYDDDEDNGASGQGNAALRRQ